MTPSQRGRIEAGGIRRQMKPWEVIATLLTAGQLRIRASDLRPVIMCLRTSKEITLENVRTIQVEHWPIKAEHGGPVSPDNAVISLAEGHKAQTKKEARDKKHERKLRIARLAKREVEQRVSKSKWRLKKKMSGEVVRVRTA